MTELATGIVVAPVAFGSGRRWPAAEEWTTHIAQVGRQKVSAFEEMAFKAAASSKTVRQIIGGIAWEPLGNAASKMFDRNPSTASIAFDSLPAFNVSELQSVCWKGDMP